MSFTLNIPVATDAAEKANFIVDQIEAQIANTTSFQITVSEVTQSKTLPNATALAVPTTGATTTTPYGFTTAAQANDIPVAINALEADVEALRQLVATMTTALANVGIVTIA